MQNNEPITARMFLENTFNLNFLTEDEKETIIRAMEMFAIGKCNEQRIICRNEILDEPDESDQELVNSIRDLVGAAPFPTISENKLTNFK